MASKPSIPLLYRISLLYIEPVLALGGCLILFFQPSSMLTTMTPSPLPPQAAFSSLRVLTDQLSIMQLVFAFNTGVLLRFTQDEADRGFRTWRLACLGMLMSDFLHVAASVRELGLGYALNVGGWRPEELVNFGTLGWMGAVRLGVVLGIGMGIKGTRSTRAVSNKSVQNGKQD